MNSLPPLIWMRNPNGQQSKTLKNTAQFFRGSEKVFGGVLPVPFGLPLALAGARPAEGGVGWGMATEFFQLCDVVQICQTCCGPCGRKHKILANWPSWGEKRAWRPVFVHLPCWNWEWQWANGVLIMPKCPSLAVLWGVEGQLIGMPPKNWRSPNPAPIVLMYI